MRAKILWTGPEPFCDRMYHTAPETFRQNLKRECEINLGPECRRPNTEPPRAGYHVTTERDDTVHRDLRVGLSIFHGPWNCVTKPHPKMPQWGGEVKSIKTKDRATPFAHWVAKFGCTDHRNPQMRPDLASNDTQTAKKHSRPRRGTYETRGRDPQANAKLRKTANQALVGPIRPRIRNQRPQKP